MAIKVRNENMKFSQNKAERHNDKGVYCTMLNFHSRAIVGQLEPTGWIKLIPSHSSSFESSSVELTRDVLHPKLVWELLSPGIKEEAEGNYRHNEQRAIYLPFKNGQSCQWDENDNKVLVIKTKTVSSKDQNSKRPKRQSKTKNKKNKKTENGVEESNNIIDESELFEEFRLNFPTSEQATEFHHAVQVAFPCRAYLDITGLGDDEDYFIGLNETGRMLFWWTEVCYCRLVDTCKLTRVRKQTQNEEAQEDEIKCEWKGELNLDLVSHVMRTDDNFVRMFGKDGKELLRFKLNKTFESKQDEIQAANEYVSFLNSFVTTSSSTMDSLAKDVSNLASSLTDAGPSQLID